MNPRQMEAGARPGWWRAGGLALVLAGLLWGASKPSETGYARALHGPMIGAVAIHGVSIWIRLSGPDEVQIEYGLESDPGQLSRTPVRKVSKQDDYTAVLALEGLAPATAYRYRVIVNGAPDMNQEPQGFFRFKTAPLPETPTTLSVAFGSCARIERHPVQPIWRAIESRHPDLMLWLGDNIYADTLDADILAECYQRQRGAPELQGLLRSVPQLAIWDDHDFGLNDSDRNNPVKDVALRIFRQYWANPSYGLPEAPGVFFSFSYGKADFFMLDNRYSRDPAAAPETPDKTALGDGQKAWLKQQLRASQAAFKVLVSGQPWNDEKGPGGESWEAFAHERDELLRFIREEKISGVVLLSGDNHVGELNCLPESQHGGYDLFEICASPLAQDPSVSWLNYRPIARIRQVYFGGSNFGLLSFDFAQSDPTLTVTLHDVQGNSVWTPLVLRASELRNGVSVWRSKMDKFSQQRHEREERAGKYYDLNGRTSP